MPTVKQLRKEAGLSQAKLATLSHVSLQTINRMEGGKAVTEATVTLVAQALGVAPSKITGVNILNRVKRG